MGDEIYLAVTILASPLAFLIGSYITKFLMDFNTDSKNKPKKR